MGDDIMHLVVGEIKVMGVSFMPDYITVLQNNNTFNVSFTYNSNIQVSLHTCNKQRKKTEEFRLFYLYIPTFTKRYNLQVLTMNETNLMLNKDFTIEWR